MCFRKAFSKHFQNYEQENEVYMKNEKNPAMFFTTGFFEIGLICRHFNRANVHRYFLQALSHFIGHAFLKAAAHVFCQELF